MEHNKLFFVFLFCCSLLNTKVTAQTGIPAPGMTYCDNATQSFMSTYGIPGLTFAMSKNGKLIYSRAFGNANTAGTETTQPHHLFRIASLSKPITAIAIMKLVEQGSISLSDHVFGPGGLLAGHPYLSQATITDTRIYNITVQQLLEHTAGWNRDIACFPNPTSPYSYQVPGCDPISAPLHVTSTLGVANPVTEENLIRFLLQKGLNTSPGVSYNYSNVGYLVLGEIIEAETGMSYENYVKNAILSPLGICDMHIGKNLPADRMEREGQYIAPYNTLSLYGTGQTVPWQYGGWNLEAMDAHGGWIATARDLVKLLVSVDGFATKPDILSAATINTMVTPSAVGSGYAKGWSVNSANNWWHTGSLDGTASILARTAGGYTWAIIMNKRVDGAQSNSFWNALDSLPWNCIANSPSFPTYDLMLSPSENAHDLTATAVTPNAATLNWAAGTGTSRILVGSVSDGINTYPLDGTAYTASQAFGGGTNLGNQNFVVYNGVGNSATITGLQPGTTYYFRLFEANTSAATGNYPLYKLCNSEQLIVTTTQLGVAQMEANIFKMYPNPAQDIVRIELDQVYNAVYVKVSSVTGQVLETREFNGTGQIELDVRHPAGTYFITVEADHRTKTQILLKK